MIQITPQMKIYLAVHPIDFRKGIGKLSGLCRTILNEDPFRGQLFVFRNKDGTSIKLLVYDGQGFWLFQKRLSKGRFRWWAEDSDEKKFKMEAHELQQLIWNTSPKDLKKVRLWKKVG